jgi:hypothetical protein
MNPPENDDSLDALLLQENGYTADDGFTKQVMASLPRQSRRQTSGFLLFGAAIIGSVAAALWLPWNTLPPLNLAALSSLNFQVYLPWLTVCLVITSLTWAVIAALQGDD